MLFEDCDVLSSKLNIRFVYSGLVDEIRPNDLVGLLKSELVAVWSEPLCCPGLGFTEKLYSLSANLLEVIQMFEMFKTIWVMGNHSA